MVVNENATAFVNMSSNLSASVGRWERRARNRPADVEVVQRLLETAAHVLQVPQLDPKGVDGKIAHPPATSNTVAAIETFQGHYTSSVDGLIKPDSQTWHALLDAIGHTADVHEPPSHPDVSYNAGEFFFPFPSLRCQIGLIRRVPLVLTETTAAAPMPAAICILRKAPGFTRSPTAPLHADRTRFIAKPLLWRSITASSSRVTERFRKQQL